MHASRQKLVKRRNETRVFLESRLSDLKEHLRIKMYKDSENKLTQVAFNTDKQNNTRNQKTQILVNTAFGTVCSTGSRLNILQIFRLTLAKQTVS